MPAQRAQAASVTGALVPAAQGRAVKSPTDKVAEDEVLGVGEVTALYQALERGGGGIVSHRDTTNLPRLDSSLEAI